MAHITITINDTLYNSALLTGKTISSTANSVTLHVKDKEEQYVVKEGFAEKIFKLIKDETGTPFLQESTATAGGSLLQEAVSLLSAKEKEVLLFLRKGYSYKMIAGELGKSIETIRVQIKSIYKKLNVRSNTQAVLKVIE